MQKSVVRALLTNLRSLEDLELDPFVFSTDVVFQNIYFNYCRRQGDFEGWIDKQCRQSVVLFGLLSTCDGLSSCVLII